MTMSTVDGMFGSKHRPFRCDRLLSIAVAGRDRGSDAEVALAGELCAYSAPVLADVLDALVGLGVDHIDVDLSDLTLCTSHGVVVFERTQRRLAPHGVFHLNEPFGIVRRVLQVLGVPFNDGVDTRGSSDLSWVTSNGRTSIAVRDGTDPPQL